jgi:hypothetical protein
VIVIVIVRLVVVTIKLPIFYFQATYSTASLIICSCFVSLLDTHLSTHHTPLSLFQQHQVCKLLSVIV